MAVFEWKKTTSCPRAQRGPLRIEVAISSRALWRPLGCWTERWLDSRRLHSLRGWGHARTSKFSPEVRERAVPMVPDHAEQHESEWAAIRSSTTKMGRAAETLRSWIRQAPTPARAGLPTEERAGSSSPSART